jgi:hypothetical protein
MDKIQQALDLLTSSTYAQYKYPVGYKFWIMRNNSPIEDNIVRVDISIIDLHPDIEKEIPSIQVKTFYIPRLSGNKTEEELDKFPTSKKELLDSFLKEEETLNQETKNQETKNPVSTFWANCKICDKKYDTGLTLEDLNTFGFDQDMSYCGGSPRCCL